jgi:hypothetical protein
MDGGFVLVAGTKTGVSLSVARWLNKSTLHYLLILQKKRWRRGCLDPCILMYG